MGMLDGELADVHANFVMCKRAVQVPFTHHLSNYRILGIFNCPTGIYADAGTHYMRVQCLALEHNNSAMGYGPAWADRVFDINDASNLLKGDIKWLSIQAGVGNDHSLTKNGGTGLLTSEIGT
jgi:hypothetical protein